MIKVIDVAYPILQVPSLNKQEAFLKDFGLVTTKKTSTELYMHCLLYTSPSPRDGRISRMPSSA